MKPVNPEEREPGFNSIPDPDPKRPAPTDMIDEAVGDMMDKIQEDATGKPVPNLSKSSKSKGEEH